MAGNTKQGGNTKSGADGITKREAPVTWRPSPAARMALARLLDKEGISRGELLNRIVIAADRNLSPVPGGTAEVGPLHANRPLGRVDRRVDPDKLAAFQRKAGMGGVKSRG